MNLYTIRYRNNRGTVVAEVKVRATDDQKAVAAAKRMMNRTIVMRPWKFADVVTRDGRYRIATAIKLTVAEQRKTDEWLRWGVCVSAR